MISAEEPNFKEVFEDAYKRMPGVSRAVIHSLYMQGFRDGKNYLPQPSKDAEEAATADEVRLYRQQNPDVGMHAAKLAVEKNRSRVLYTDAEEAAREYATVECPDGASLYIDQHIARAFLAGAKWAEGRNGFGRFTNERR